MANPPSDQLVGVLRDTIVALVRRDGADLSARQLGGIRPRTARYCLAGAENKVVAPR